jgi:hypothetical protein
MPASISPVLESALAITASISAVATIAAITAVGSVAAIGTLTAVAEWRLVRLSLLPAGCVRWVFASRELAAHAHAGLGVTRG